MELNAKLSVMQETTRQTLESIKVVLADSTIFCSLSRSYRQLQRFREKRAAAVVDALQAEALHNLIIFSSSSSLSNLETFKSRQKPLPRRLNSISRDGRGEQIPRAERFVISSFASEESIKAEAKRFNEKN